VIAGVHHHGWIVFEFLEGKKVCKNRQYKQILKEHSSKQ
jgi:hypothetical protein